MVLSTAIVLVLCAAMVRGWHRGLLAVVVSLAIYLITLVVARIIAPVIGQLIAASQPSVNGRTTFAGSLLADANPTVFFYNGIAFSVIFVVISFLLHHLARQLSWLSRLPVLGTVNSFTGAAVAMIISYLMIYVLLLIFQLWSNGWWQYQFSQSEVARWIVNNTPQLASLLVNWLG